MPVLRQTKLYTRAELARALTSAGQFSHVRIGEDGWCQALGMLYHDKSLRHRLANDLSHSPVPDGVVSAWRRGLCEQVYAPLGTLEWLAESYGSVCALCGEICHNQGYCAVSDGLHLDLFLMPTFLGVVSPYGGVPNWTISALCIDCKTSVCAAGKPRFGRRGSGRCDWRNPLDCMSTLLWATNKARTGIRRRITSNRSTWAELRFDPRRGIEAINA